LPFKKNDKPFVSNQQYFAMNQQQLSFFGMILGEPFVDSDTNSSLKSLKCKPYKRGSRSQNH